MAIRNPWVRYGCLLFVPIFVLSIFFRESLKPLLSNSAHNGSAHRVPRPLATSKIIVVGKLDSEDVSWIAKDLPEYVLHHLIPHLMTLDIVEL